MPRSKIIPTEEQRNKVKHLSSIHLKQSQICAIMGLQSERTLRRLYSKELVAGRIGSTMRVYGAAFKFAVSKRHPLMTIFWLKTRAGWSKDMVLEPTAANPSQYDQIRWIIGEAKPPQWDPTEVAESAPQRELDDPWEPDGT